MILFRWYALHDADVESPEYTIEGVVEAPTRERAEAVVREAQGFDTAWDVWVSTDVYPIAGGEKVLRDPEDFEQRLTRYNAEHPPTAGP